MVISSPAAGHILRHDGTDWDNVLGTTYFQPVDSDLTSIAALTTTSYGRGLLELANQGALMALLGAASATAAGVVELATDAEALTGTDTVRAITPANLASRLSSYQPVDSDLTSIAALTTTSYGRALLELADQAALMALMRAASETATGIVELATTTEVTTGTDTTRAVTPAGVQAAINALVDAAPGTLNTLNELAAALGDDPNFATTITNSIAGKQPLDTDLTAIAALTSAADQLPYATGAGTWALTTITAAGRALLDDADAAAMRGTLSVYSQAEIGNPETNFVTTFEAGLV